MNDVRQRSTVRRLQGIVRHALIALIGGLLSVPSIAEAQKLPITGTAVPTFQPFDEMVLEFQKTIGCQAATLAISKDGELLYSRGYGWRDMSRKQSTSPDTTMRLASVTKPFTASAVKTLIRENKLTLDTRVFEFLDITPPAGVTPDPRLRTITVAHLLDHRGGWDRDKTYDPMFRPTEVQKRLNVRRTPRHTDVIRFMLTQPLQFDPGEERAYSNFGYCVLGRVIEKASGMSYEKYIRETICQPIGITNIAVGKPGPSRLAGEVWSPEANVLTEAMDSHGGLITSAPALCLFLDHYWITGEPRQPHQKGNWMFFGSLPGTTAMVRQHSSGYNVALLANNRRNKHFREDHDQLHKSINQLLESLPSHWAPDQ